MKYERTVRGRFRDRPNRFIAHIWVRPEDVAPGSEYEPEEELVLETDSEPEPEPTLRPGVGKSLDFIMYEGGWELVTVHVKNTGRCRELLIPGVEVVLQKAANPDRKTKYDLISVYKESVAWVNIDSQVPNKVVAEWLPGQGFENIRPEFTFGESRLDFYAQRDGQEWLIEVKGCTLEIDGMGYFPDAPSPRAHRHLRELASARDKGFRCAVAYVIAMEWVKEVKPYTVTDPEYGVAMEEALAAGVEVWNLSCQVEQDEIRIIDNNVVK